MHFKDMLSEVKRATDALAAAAATLENQHLADIVKGASGRLHDAMNHPDADNVDGREALAAMGGAAETGEPNHMDPGPQPKGAPFPGGPAETGEPNPMKG
jgi:hypothetical protein